MESSILSDHDPVYVVLRLKKIWRKQVYITAKSLKHYQPSAFNEDISQAPCLTVYAFDVFDDKLGVFHWLFMDRSCTS